MKIGIDASRANRPLRTGTEWYSFYIIQHLAALDRDNQYILYLDREPAVDLAAAVAPYKNFKFKILRWPWRYFWTLGRLSLEMIFSRPDILFVPAHSLPFFSPRRTVTTIHDIAFIRDSGLYQKKTVRMSSVGWRKFIELLVRLATGGRYHSDSLDYLFWSTAYALRHASKIIAVSEFTKQEILDVYSSSYIKKIEVVHNGYARNLYHPFADSPERRSILSKYGLEEPFFLYVGRLEKKKNTPALTEAFAIFKDSHPENNTKLALIGNAGFGYDEVKYIIEEYNLGREILMPGWAEETDLPAIFSAAKAFIFPTLHEGFGIPVLQAMACGVSVLLSDLPVLREIAGESAWYFDPYNKQDIAASFAKLDNEPEKSANRIKFGLARASQFSWEKSAKETLSVLMEA